MGLFNLFKPAQTVLVIDTVSLNESLGMKGNVPPRNQLQLVITSYSIHYTKLYE